MLPCTSDDLSSSAIILTVPAVSPWLLTHLLASTRSGRDLGPVLNMIPHPTAARPPIQISTNLPRQFLCPPDHQNSIASPNIAPGTRTITFTIERRAVAKPLMPSIPSL